MSDLMWMNGLKRSGGEAGGAGGTVGTLVRALTAQKGLYEQILALAKQQSQYVATGESEALMTVLGARSRLIEQVVPLDRELELEKGGWEEVVDGGRPAERKGVGGLLQEVQRLLGEILALD